MAFAKITHIAGTHEIDDWPEPLAPPVYIASYGRYRDRGTRGPTYGVDLGDSSRLLHPFFFDREFGRLCYGMHHDDDNAAFLKLGSRIEVEAFALIHDLAMQSPEFAEVLAYLQCAKPFASDIVSQGDVVDPPGA